MSSKTFQVISPGALFVGRSKRHQRRVVAVCEGMVIYDEAQGRSAMEVGDFREWAGFRIDEKECKTCGHVARTFEPMEVVHEGD